MDSLTNLIGDRKEKKIIFSTTQNHAQPHFLPLWGKSRNPHHHKTQLSLASPQSQNTYSEHSGRHVAQVQVTTEHIHKPQCIHTSRDAVFCTDQEKSPAVVCAFVRASERMSPSTTLSVVAYIGPFHFKLWPHLWQTVWIQWQRSASVPTNALLTAITWSCMDTSAISRRFPPKKGN